MDEFTTHRYDGLCPFQGLVAIGYFVGDENGTKCRIVNALFAMLGLV
jgi:hypothetical protein